MKQHPPQFTRGPKSLATRHSSRTDETGASSLFPLNSNSVDETLSVGQKDPPPSQSHNRTPQHKTRPLSPYGHRCRQMAVFLGQSIQWLPGVGPKWAQRLESEGLRTYWDVLCRLPQRFVSYTVGALPQRSGYVIIAVTVVKTLSTKPWKILVRTQHQDTLCLLFFRKPKAPWPLGQMVWIRGLVETTLEYGWTMTHPQRIPDPTPMTSGHLAEYTLPKSLSSAVFSKWVRTILTQWPHQDWSPWVLLPVEQKPAWEMSWHACFTQAHFPSKSRHECPADTEKLNQPDPWQTALASAEWLASHVATLSWSQQSRHHGQAPVCPKVPVHIQDFLSRFGHALTPTQAEAWSLIQDELAQSTPMLRLLNGDVGSGKTIVAFLALLQATAGGQHQACLMAPTETLIRQHYEQLIQLAPPHTVQLILGKGVRFGPMDAPIILGTHALLYEAIVLDRLALVVIDEQQRFGVEQRAALTQKRPVHSLYITATPIPRTFARLMSGDLAISSIEKRPGAPLMTSYVMSSEKIPQLAEWIQRCFQRDQRVYWVCPMITDETSGVDTRWAFWDGFFPGQVGILHGRMNAVDKDAAIQSFRQGSTPLLVSTTVIEVGVHVAQATTMIIEDAPRFGLSQLHQLRGRVGRDQEPGHCFFLYTPPLLPHAQKRLQSLRSCHNGFEIAENDWLMRGSGVVHGTQQSGHKTHHFIHDHVTHAKMAVPTVPTAQYLFANEPEAATWLMSLFGLRGDDLWMSG